MNHISNLLFPRILNMSLTGSIVIAAVLTIRFFLRKAPKKWSYLLWLVVAFRLVCPVSFSSPVSLLGAVNAPVTSTGTIEYIPHNTTQPQSPALSPDFPVPDTAGPVPELPSVTTSISFMDVLAVLWLAGAAALLIYSAVTYLRLRHRLSCAIFLQDRVWQSDRVQSPFILGLFCPRIYIPFGLDEQTLNYVLAHERYHLKRCDHVVKPLAFLLLTLHWFNPLCWLAFHLMGRDMEMSCDEQVLAQKDGDRKVYSTALLSFAANRRFPSPSPLAFDEGEVRPRITNVLNWKKPKVWVTVAAGILCVIVLLLCALNPKSTPQILLGRCTVTQNGMVTEYRMERHTRPLYLATLADNEVYDARSLPRAAVADTGYAFITFFAESEDAQSLDVTEYYHFTDGSGEYAHSGHMFTLTRDKNGGFLHRIYPRGEGPADYVVYQVRYSDGWYLFRVDLVANAPFSSGPYTSVEEYLSAVLAAEQQVTLHSMPDGQFSSPVIDRKVTRLAKHSELPDLAPQGVLELWTYEYALKLDVGTDPSRVLLDGANDLAEDGWYYPAYTRNVIALRHEDGSCTILHDFVDIDGYDFWCELSPQQALYDWYVKEYDLTDRYPLYVMDWPQGEGMSLARRYDSSGNAWSIYIPVNVWNLSGIDSWNSAYGTGAALTVSNSTASLNELLQTARAEGRPITEEDGCYRIDREYSSTFLYPHPVGGACWTITIQWPAAPSQDPYAPTPEQEREELFRMARSLVPHPLPVATVTIS